MSDSEWEHLDPNKPTENYKKKIKDLKANALVIGALMLAFATTTAMLLIDKESSDEFCGVIVWEAMEMLVTKFQSKDNSNLAELKAKLN